MWITASWEHPRVRGEGLTYNNYATPGLGTPPRARGRAPIACLRRRLTGNTPACAGKGERARCR